MDNPYAPPLAIAGARDLTQRSNYLELPWSFAVLGGLGASLLSGGCVLIYQVSRYSYGWPRIPALSWTMIPESASFSSAVLFMVLIFTMSRREGHARSFGLALLCWLAGLVLYATAVLLMEFSLMEFSREFALPLYLSFISASQMLTAATVCRFHRIRLRPLRLLVGGLLGVGAWVSLTMGAIWLIVQPLSHPWDDFAGFSLLTMFWCWVVALQMPLMLNKRLRERPEP